MTTYLSPIRLEPRSLSLYIESFDDYTNTIVALAYLWDGVWSVVWWRYQVRGMRYEVCGMGYHVGQWDSVLSQRVGVHSPCYHSELESTLRAPASQCSVCSVYSSWRQTLNFLFEAAISMGWSKPGPHQHQLAEASQTQCLSFIV